MQCDVCNKAVASDGGKRVTADQFSRLLERGFGVDEGSISMLTSVGKSREQALHILKQQYHQSASDWLLCTQCAAEADSILADKKDSKDTPEYFDISETAAEVGMGFKILGAPVAVSSRVWSDYIEWSDQDSSKQTFQEQDARLWDVLFTGGGTLQAAINQFAKKKVHRYSVLCVPRDGTATEAVTIGLLMRPQKFGDETWLVIDRDEQFVPEESDW